MLFRMFVDWNSQSSLWRSWLLARMFQRSIAAIAWVFG
jgi:hypothetical protein